MRIMITGGTGFIGGAAAWRLLGRGDEVVIFARSAARAAVLASAGATVVVGELEDAGALGRAAAGCEVVLHAAGVPRPASWKTFRAVHIEGTRQVLAAARAAGVRRFVHVASQAVIFAGKDLIDVDESHPYPERYIDPYSATKGEAERVALAENGRGLEVTSVRPGVVWGPGDTTVLPIMAKLARSPAGVPMCGDGTNTEATTYIENLTDGILAAMSSPVGPGRAYFILDGFRISWKGFLSAQLQAAGVRPKFLRVPKGIAVPGAWALDHAAGALGLPVPLALFGVKNAMTSRVLSGERAKRELGHEGRVGLEEGMRALEMWVKEVGGARELIGLPGKLRAAGRKG